MAESRLNSYAEAVRFLEQGINYEKTRQWQYNTRYLNLTRVERLLESIGNPHLDYRVLHVAGTKGKGSTAGAAAHLLCQAGRRTGLLTSPHLVTPRERIRIDGDMISEEAFLRGVRTMERYVETRRGKEQSADRAPTYFEMLTALAFDEFRQQQVDWAVVEVGLGGRLDSTNVVQPTCCAVTTIGFDHMDKLGDTVEAIATEKAGIMKHGVPVVIGKQHYKEALTTLRRIADERGSPRREVGREIVVTACRPLCAHLRTPDSPVGWRFSLRTPVAHYRELVTPMLGSHQVSNLAAAIGCVEVCCEAEELALTPQTVANALADFSLPARIEVLRRGPAVVLDVAHTVESIRALLDALETHFPGRRLRVVFGCSADKNIEGMLSALRGRCVAFTATQAHMPRALPVEAVLQAAQRTGLADAVEGGVHAIPDTVQAVESALAEAAEDEVVCLTGSFFTAGELRAAWIAEHGGIET